MTLRMQEDETDCRRRANDVIKAKSGESQRFWDFNLTQ